MVKRNTYNLDELAQALPTFSLQILASLSARSSSASASVSFQVPPEAQSDTHMGLKYEEV